MNKENQTIYTELAYCLNPALDFRKPSLTLAGSARGEYHVAQFGGRRELEGTAIWVKIIDSVLLMPQFIMGEELAYNADLPVPISLVTAPVEGKSVGILRDYARTPFEI